VKSSEPELINSIRLYIEDVYTSAPRGINALGIVRTDIDEYKADIYLAISSIPVKNSVGIMGSVHLLSPKTTKEFEKVFYMPTSSSLEEVKHLLVYAASRFGTFDEDCVIEIENEDKLSQLVESVKYV
jgi:hypothetical protein